MKEIVIATKNAHKTKEFKEMLEPLGFQVKDLNDFAPITIIEDGNSFEENALIKARTLHKATGLCCMADDSGLEITALDGKPGIYSSRWLGEDTPYEQKNQMIIDMVKDASDRSARFVCSIAVVDEEEKVFTGYFEGQVAYEAKGEYGFGYDPIFYLPEYQMTSAELLPEEKNRISHRGNALRMVLPYILERMHE